MRSRSVQVQFDILDIIIHFSDQYVTFCGLILGPDTLVQYLDVQKSASERACNFKKNYLLP